VLSLLFLKGGHEEVLVNFLEGDPDKPVISGIFLNENMDVKK